MDATVLNKCASCVHHDQDPFESPCAPCIAWGGQMKNYTPKSPPPAQPTAPRTAPEFLRSAADIMDERGRTYDQPTGERSMVRTVTAFNAITGQDMTEAQAWLFMQVLKDTRQWQKATYHQDSAEDCIAYAALKAEALASGGGK